MKLTVWKPGFHAMSIHVSSLWIYKSSTLHWIGNSRTYIVFIVQVCSVRLDESRLFGECILGYASLTTSSYKDLYSIICLRYWCMIHSLSSRDGSRVTYQRQTWYGPCHGACGRWLDCTAVFWVRPFVWELYIKFPTSEVCTSISYELLWRAFNHCFWFWKCFAFAIELR